MAIGYPKRDEGEDAPECEACGSILLVLDALGKPLRCKECGAEVKDPFAV
jgi:tRNA(Ile2) C34 agmatinyltransferase TiaS